MSKVRSFCLYWLPVIIWMWVIFSASADSRSAEHSSRIIAPLVKFFVPDISEKSLDHIVTVCRKGAHLTEYALLALLFWRAVRQPSRHDRRPWSWRLAGAAVLFVAVYAATDEFHQKFVATREPSVRDVVIDTIGAALGMLGLWVIRRGRGKLRRDAA